MFTIFQASTTADYDDVLENYYHVFQGSRLPYTGTRLKVNNGDYDIGASATMFAESHFNYHYTVNSDIIYKLVHTIDVTEPTTEITVQMSYDAGVFNKDMDELVIMAIYSQGNTADSSYLNIYPCEDQSIAVSEIHACAETTWSMSESYYTLASHPNGNRAWPLIGHRSMRFSQSSCFAICKIRLDKSQGIVWEGISSVVSQHASSTVVMPTPCVSGGRVENTTIGVQSVPPFIGTFFTIVSSNQVTMSTDIKIYFLSRLSA